MRPDEVESPKCTTDRHDVRSDASEAWVVGAVEIFAAERRGVDGPDVAASSCAWTVAADGEEVEKPTPARPRPARVRPPRGCRPGRRGRGREAATRAIRSTAADPEPRERPVADRVLDVAPGQGGHPDAGRDLGGGPEQVGSVARRRRREHDDRLVPQVDRVGANAHPAQRLPPQHADPRGWRDEPRPPPPPPWRATAAQAAW